MWKAILFNHEAVVPSGLEWATGQVISVLHKKETMLIDKLRLQMKL